METKQIIAHPATLKLDDNTRIDVPLGVAVGVGTGTVILAVAVVKNILNCYRHYASMLANVEQTTRILGELQSDQTANFGSIKEDFAAINQSIKELQISLNSSQARIMLIEKSLEYHAEKIERLEAVTSRIVGRLGET